MYHRDTPHHGKACVYLEDPRPGSDRGTADVSRAMKLSLIRWDSPELPKALGRANPDLPRPPATGIDSAEGEDEAPIGQTGVGQTSVVADAAGKKASDSASSEGAW